jgi:hypothetical protein
MRTMTLMAVLAMVAATHSIATRTASASDTTNRPATTIRTYDLPAVRVYATVERERSAFDKHALDKRMLDERMVVQAPRIHDLPPVRVHAVREVADARGHAVAMRMATARRASLAIPRGSQRRALWPQRGAPSRIEERVDGWVALGCVVRMRLARVWPMAHCGDATAGARSTGAAATVPVSLVARRR